jgi:hypothetical protein
VEETREAILNKNGAPKICHELTGGKLNLRALKNNGMEPIKFEELHLRLDHTCMYESQWCDDEMNSST